MRHVSARRPSPALAISIVALFVALGGSAYAAAKVGTKDIEDRAITVKKLRKGAVATGKIRKHAVNTKAAPQERGRDGQDPQQRDHHREDQRRRGDRREGRRGDPEPGPERCQRRRCASIQRTPSTPRSAENAVNWSRYVTSGLRKAGIGQTIELASVGPFTFHGRCTDTRHRRSRSRIIRHHLGARIFHALAARCITTKPNSNPAIEAEPRGRRRQHQRQMGPGHRRVRRVDGDQPRRIGDPARVRRARAVHVFGADCAYQLSWPKRSLSSAQSSFSRPTVKRIGQLADPAHGEDDAGHERAAVDRVVSQARASAPRRRRSLPGGRRGPAAAPSGSAGGRCRRRRRSARRCGRRSPRGRRASCRGAARRSRTPACAARSSARRPSSAPRRSRSWGRRSSGRRRLPRRRRGRRRGRSRWCRRRRGRRPPCRLRRWPAPCRER